MFLFAALQSKAGKQLLDKYKIDWQANDSFVVIDKNEVYIKGNAALKLYSKLPWYWKWTQLFWIVPKFIRDWVYTIIAKNRYKWFGRKNECMVPTAELSTKFLE